MKKKKKKLWGSQPDRNGLECLIYYDLFVKFFDFVEFDLIYNSDSASWRLTICYWRINLLVMPSKSSIYQFSDYGDFFSNFRPPSWVHHLESSENTIIFATSSDLKPRPPPPSPRHNDFHLMSISFSIVGNHLASAILNFEKYPSES